MPARSSTVLDAPHDPDTTVAPARKSHVAVVGHSVGAQVFGAERSLLDLLAAVDRQTYELSCVLPTSNDEYLRSVAKHTKNITVFPYEWWSKTRPFDEKTVSRFESLFRHGGVDLVHTNTIMLMDPLLAARRLDVPSIVHARELITYDDDLAGHFGHEPSTVVHTIRTAADFTIANSDFAHRLYRKPGRSFRLYNSVDVDSFDLPNHLEPGRLRIGIISDNLPKKGIEHFVKLAMLAGRRRPELEFVVFGPRTEHVDRLKHLVRRAGVPVRLRFSDYVAHPLDAIRQVNVVASFSIVAESFGRTIVEAMAARRPVIAYGWGATPELVRHGVEGFLIPYRHFAKALEHLETLADHPERVLEMGRNGRARAERLFSTDVFASQLNGIYRQIMEVWKARGRAHS